MQIIDGYVGTPNIYADVIGEHNISMYGSGDYVLNVGECLGYELISNNEIRIKDGMFITQGRRGYIKKGTTEVCRIDNGAQSGKRNDLIVIEYAKDLSTQVESHTIRVLKGIPGAEASDPEITTGNIPDGAILHQMPLYRVKIEGLSVAAVEQMFEFGSVAAETVNPMLATEEGFAADAYQTKLQFDEQNKNIETLGESVSNGKTLVANAITAKGVSTSTIATFPTMATNIGKIKTTPTSFTSGQGNSNNNISGLTVGETYILSMANLGNSDTTLPSIKSGGTVLKTINAQSTSKYSGYYTQIITIMFKATSTTVVLKDVTSHAWFSYSLVKV